MIWTAALLTSRRSKCVRPTQKFLPYASNLRTMCDFFREHLSSRKKFCQSLAITSGKVTQRFISSWERQIRQATGHSWSNSQKESLRSTIARSQCGRLCILSILSRWRTTKTA